MEEIPVTGLMSHDVELIEPDMPLREVVHRMKSLRHSCEIVGQQGEPLGIITERDLVKLFDRVLDNPALSNCVARDIMTSPPHTISEDQSLFDALVIARAERIRHLPVIDMNLKLTGLLTQTDLTEAHFQVIEKQRDIIEHAVETRTESLREANEELQALSMEDALLGIGNRRAMEVDIVHTHAIAERYHRQYSILLADIDYFKLYNDHYGHMAGDECLIKVAEHLKKAIRKSDRLYRYGGEEFLLLLPDTNISGGEILAQRLVDDLNKLEIPHCKSSYGVVTMSAGLACCSENQANGLTWQQVVEKADRALYQAKSNGRNKAA